MMKMMSANQSLVFVVKPTDNVALKIRGLPWRVEVEEIEQFFSRYAYVRDSIKIGELADGRKTGQATLLFENEDEAANAMNEKQG
jgi:RNA recognition motif-containing protein